MLDERGQNVVNGGIGSLNRSIGGVAVLASSISDAPGFAIFIKYNKFGQENADNLKMDDVVITYESPRKI